MAAWLQERPPAWGTADRANPILAFRSELHALPPESQAWLLMAVRVRPELVNPSPPRDSAHPFGSSHAAYIGGDAQDLPAAAAIIAERVRSSLASRERRSSAEAFSLAHPLEELKLLVEIRPGDPELAKDAATVASLLQSRGTWSPVAQIELGRDLLGAAEGARTDSARSALVRPATDAIIEGNAAYYRARPELMTIQGPIGLLYRTYTSKEEPIIREIEARFLERASLETCPNFGEDVLPVSRKALAALWTDRFARGADALCLWHPPHWVPVDEIVARCPEAALKLVAHPTRPGDALRREILVKSLMPYVFVDGDWSGSNEEAPTGSDAKSAFARAIREEVKPPSFRLDMDADGLAIVRFRDAEFERAWQSRPAAHPMRSPRGENLAALSALLGTAESDLRPLIEQEFVPRGCLVNSLQAEVWGSPKDRWRLARLDCAGPRRSPALPLPLTSAAWPRNASDADAFSWLVWDYQPLILADAKGARVVWLPDRVLAHETMSSKRIVGVADLDGDMVMVVQSFDGPCGPDPCGKEDLHIEISELTENVFSFLRKPTRAK